MTPRSKSRRRDPRAGARPATALLHDPATVHAAAAAAALAGGSASYWPFAVAVSPATVDVHMAGIAVPPPTAPWRPGHDQHVWIADRAAVDGRQGPLGRLVIVGRFRESVVFVDTSRAPGPISVAGHGAGRDTADQADQVRELIDAQTHAPLSAEHPRGSYWAMTVQDGVIVLLGLGIGFVFSPDESRLAAALMRQAAEEAAVSPGAESTHATQHEAVVTTAEGKTATPEPEPQPTDPAITTPLWVPPEVDPWADAVSSAVRSAAGLASTHPDDMPSTDRSSQPSAGVAPPPGHVEPPSPPTQPPPARPQPSRPEPERDAGPPRRPQPHPTPRRRPQPEPRPEPSRAPAPQPELSEHEVWTDFAASSADRE